jgi:hypothetical protein
LRIAQVYCSLASPQFAQHWYNADDFVVREVEMGGAHREGEKIGLRSE